MEAGLSSLENDDERNRMSELYEKNKLTFMKIAMGILHNQHRAEDALHNAFVSIIKHKEKAFSLDSREFLAWGITIVKNKCLDLIEKEAKLDFVEDIEMHLEYPDSVSIESQVILKSQYEDMKRYLEELDIKSQVALEMRYLHDMNYSEIAEEMGITIDNVDSLIYRAKKKLRKLIGEKGDLL